MGKNAQRRRHQKAGTPYQNQKRVPSKSEILVNLDTAESLYEQRFTQKYPELIEFVLAAGNLCNRFLTGLYGMRDLNDKQKACIFLIGKAQRLLRSIYNTCRAGNWPEAIPDSRAMFEAFQVLEYILMDKTTGRATTWLTRKKESHWQMAQLMKDKGVLSDIYAKDYANMSLNPHSHAASFTPYLEFDDEDNSFAFHTGPLFTNKDDEQAEKVLGLAARRAVSFCEISRSVFPYNEDWEKRHEVLMELKHIKAPFEATKKLIEENDELRYDLTQHLQKIHE